MTCKRRFGLTVLALLLSSCAVADDAADEQPADTAAATSASAVDATGTWNMRAVPTSGSDTTSTIFQIEVANGVWTLKLPNREPIVANVTADADSFIVEAGPYESVRRAGVTVSTRSVYRINGDQVTGNTVATYQEGATTSELPLTVTGTRVR